MKMKIKIKTGFTLIELLIIVAIIGLLASIILVAWGISAQNKAAIASYKTSMDSVRAAAEMCAGAGGTVIPGAPDSPVCNPDNNTNYPTISSRCGVSGFGVSDGGSESAWMVTTDADCKGCKLECRLAGCKEAAGTECD